MSHGSNYYNADEEPEIGLQSEAVNGDNLTDGIESIPRHSAHVLLIPHPAVPHITPMVHLAEQLGIQGAIQCTILSYDFLLDKVAKDELSDGIHLLGLPKDLTGFSPMKPGTLPVISNSEELHFTTKKYVEKLLQEEAEGKERHSYVCLISDYMQDWSIDLAAKLGCSRYLFAASSSFFCLTLASYYLYTDTGDQAESNRANSWLSDSSMPRVKVLENGTPSADTTDLVKVMVKSKAYAEMVLINSFRELESRAVDYLRSMGEKVLLVGPLQSSVQVSKVSFGGDSYVDDECLQWLDKQPAKSVVYVNFGTTGFNFWTLKMVHELALGLEASQARFLWILRPPPNLKQDELDQLLPTGFEQRVKYRALILRGWAPQLKILEHPATSAFFMQCGWNSMLESVVRGIPFIGWATFADQPHNGQYLADVTKSGLLLPHKEKNVDRYDVETSIRTMMFSAQGLLIRRKADELKIAAANVIKPGGSSHKDLLEFVQAIRVA